MDWATAGIGASALASLWNSPLLVEVTEHTLGAILGHPDLLATLEQIEDFRALAQNAQQVVTSTKKLKKAKREQDGELDPGQKKEQSDTAKQRKERSEEHTSELQSLMRNSYAVYGFKKQITYQRSHTYEINIFLYSRRLRI